jgi:hypothetical protein
MDDPSQKRIFSIVAMSDAAEFADTANLLAIVSDERRAAIPIQMMAIATATAVATIFKWVAASALQMEAFMAPFQIAGILILIRGPCDRAL